MSETITITIRDAKLIAALRNLVELSGDGTTLDGFVTETLRAAIMMAREAAKRAAKGDLLDPRD